MQPHCTSRQLVTTLKHAPIRESRLEGAPQLKYLVYIIENIHYVYDYRQHSHRRPTPRSGGARCPHDYLTQDRHGTEGRSGPKCRRALLVGVPRRVRAQPGASMRRNFRQNHPQAVGDTESSNQSVPLRAIVTRRRRSDPHVTAQKGAKGPSARSNWRSGDIVGGGSARIGARAPGEDARSRAPRKRRA